MAQRLRDALVAFCALVTSAPAHACTVCDSPTGHAVRSGLFGAHFLPTLLAVLAPAPVLALAVTSMHLFMPDLDESVPSSGTLVLPEADLPA